MSDNHELANRRINSKSDLTFATKALLNRFAGLLKPED